MKFVIDENYGCEEVKVGLLAKFGRAHDFAPVINVSVRRGGLTGLGERNQCHLNACLLAYRYGGKVLTGWFNMLPDWSEDFVQISAHSVWITPESIAVCPTAHSWFGFYQEKFEFIPVFEYDQEDVSGFIEENTPLSLPSALLVDASGNHFRTYGYDDAETLRSVLSPLNTKQRIATAKYYAKRSKDAGTKSAPLRSAVLSKKKKFVGSVDSNHFTVKYGISRFAQRVLPELYSITNNEVLEKQCVC